MYGKLGCWQRVFWKVWFGAKLSIGKYQVVDWQISLMIGPKSSIFEWHSDLLLMYSKQICWSPMAQAFYFWGSSLSLHHL